MQLSFFVTPEGDITTAEPTAEPPVGTLRFTTQQELAQLAQHWPLRRLVQLWNDLPGIRLVQRFEDKDIADEPEGDPQLGITSTCGPCC